MNRVEFEVDDNVALYDQINRKGRKGDGSGKKS